MSFIGREFRLMSNPTLLNSVRWRIHKVSGGHCLYGKRGRLSNLSKLARPISLTKEGTKQSTPALGLEQSLKILRSASIEKHLCGDRVCSIHGRHTAPRATTGHCGYIDLIHATEVGSDMRMYFLAHSCRATAKTAGPFTRELVAKQWI